MTGTRPAAAAGCVTRGDTAFNQPSSLSCTFLPFLLEVGDGLADEVAGGLGLASEVAGGGPASPWGAAGGAGPAF